MTRHRRAALYGARIMGTYFLLLFNTHISFQSCNRRSTIDIRENRCIYTRYRRQHSFDWPNEFNTKNVNIDLPRSLQAQGKKAEFVLHDDVTFRSWNSCWFDLRTFSAVIYKATCLSEITRFPSLERSKKGSWVTRSSVRKLGLSAAYSLPATANSDLKLFLELSIGVTRLKLLWVINICYLELLDIC